MYWDNPSKENGRAGEDAYLHPEYYQSPEVSQSSPEYTPPPDPYASYVQEPIREYDYNALSRHDPTFDMEEYRHPSSIEGYTPDPGSEQREAAKSGTAGGKRKGLAGAGGTAIGLGALILKFQALLFPLLKFGLAGFTALVSVWIYSTIFGWPFAIGLVVLLFIHEMGHAVVMKIKGIPVGGMIFIPLLGAAVLMRQMPQNAKDEAEVGIAGPFAGAIAASVCFVLAQSSHGPSIWAGLAYFGFFLNLFNLIPVVPFDGGRVLGAIDRRIWIIGFLALLGFQIWSWLHGTFSIWLLFFVFMAATQLFSRTPNNPANRGYYDVPLGTRIILGLLYFGLAAILVLGMTMSMAMLRVAQ